VAGGHLHDLIFICIFAHMKHLLVVILLLMAGLVATVTGCRGTRVPDDVRLVAADSLLASAPDSALALVEALALDSLATDGDRAYRDLLLTQARYKCYIIATSDSDINRALGYYRAHSGEQEKLTRAYIYKGAVMEELGHPDSAMLYYKHAEATAAPDDYFNLGYDRLHKAANSFTAANDTNYLIIAIGSLGALYTSSDKSLSKEYLQNAISLAEAIGSPKRFRYQSKLAGIYFYQGDYINAKNLAMDILQHGRSVCEEDQFYYYAARSFIKLSCLDSAYYVKSIIPPPSERLDSMNHYLLEAELAQAEHRYKDFAFYLGESKKIDDRILTNSLESNIAEVELKWDANCFNEQDKKRIYGRTLFVSAIIILSILLVSIWLVERVIKRRIRRYQSDLDSTQQELEETIDKYNAKIRECESAISKQKELLSKRDNNSLKPILEENNNELHSQHLVMNEQVATVIRSRLSALNELYYDIRIKSSSQIPLYKHPLPLMSLIKELNDEKRLLYVTPKSSFWKKLKMSVDGEYMGIATFVEENFPQLTPGEHHLFWLLCARISPQIIKLCMNYSNAVTVSNYKRKLIRERMGLDMKFEEFIEHYLNSRKNDV